MIAVRIHVNVAEVELDYMASSIAALNTLPLITVDEACLEGQKRISLAADAGS